MPEPLRSMCKCSTEEQNEECMDVQEDTMDSIDSNNVHPFRYCLDGLENCCRKSLVKDSYNSASRRCIERSMECI